MKSVKKCWGQSGGSCYRWQNLWARHEKMTPFWKLFDFLRVFPNKPTQNEYQRKGLFMWINNHEKYFSFSAFPVPWKIFYEFPSRGPKMLTWLSKKFKKFILQSLYYTNHLRIFSDFSNNGKFGKSWKTCLFTMWKYGAYTKWCQMESVPSLSQDTFLQLDSSCFKDSKNTLLSLTILHP